MRVHYSEGLATRTGPKPCAGVREDVGEASAGDRTGQPLSRERKKVIPSADVVSCAEGNMTECAMRALCRLGVVTEPGMCGRSLHGNREISGLTTRNANGVARIGKARSRSR